MYNFIIKAIDVNDPDRWEQIAIEAESEDEALKMSPKKHCLGRNTSVKLEILKKVDIRKPFLNRGEEAVALFLYAAGYDGLPEEIIVDEVLHSQFAVDKNGRRLIDKEVKDGVESAIDRNIIWRDQNSRTETSYLYTEEDVNKYFQLKDDEILPYGYLDEVAKKEFGMSITDLLLAKKLNSIYKDKPSSYQKSNKKKTPKIKPKIKGFKTASI